MFLHVATKKGLFVYDLNGGKTALTGRHFLGDNLSLTGADPRDGTWYAFQDLGHFGVKVQRSEDHGATWTEVGVPTYPKQAEDENETTPDGKPFVWSLKKVWSFAVGGADQPGRLWCGTIPGGLFRSDDRGTTWQLCEGLWRHPTRSTWFGGGADLPGIHSVCVDPRDPRVLRVAVSCAGVWTSRDEGATWTLEGKGLRAAFMPPEQAYDQLSQDPHCMVQSPTQPDRLWIQHHNGIFRCDDGTTWTELTDVPPSVFGFAVAVHPQDGDTAWFVPAIKDEHRYPVDGKVVVTRTRDGGKTWEVLRKGLPQQDAYDLTYRHGLDVAGDGKTLAFGSTTGSLWVSRDGGDSWETVSAHLPPIHSVRFA